MRANILGFGVMGRQISGLLQILGYEVFAWSRQMTSEKQRIYEKDLKLLRRTLSVKDILGSVVYVEDINQLEPCTTIEVLCENLGIKTSVLTHLRYGFDKVDLFTNTSSYSPKEISPLAHGLHFLNPIYALKFAEVTFDFSELKTEGQQFMRDLQSLGFALTRVTDNRGYIGNYVLFHEISAALRLVELYGYKSRTIDQVLSHMGRPISLFDIVDLVGIDVTKSIINNLREVDPSIYLSALLDEAIKKNVFGRKNRTSIRDVIDV